MQKVRLEIVGLTSGQSHGSYTLILGEENGSRKLPIIIGSFEAQAIAIEIEKIVPFRPMTHDLFVSFSKSFEIQVEEVIIHNLVDGVFYAKLLCRQDGVSKEIDARTSDAIALSVRFKCPISTYEHILASAGIVINEEPAETDEENPTAAPAAQVTTSKEEISAMSLEQLDKLLEEAISVEDYARAAMLRDEISKRKDKNS
jgi:bifunctional DNase/RNase